IARAALNSLGLRSFNVRKTSGRIEFVESGKIESLEGGLLTVEWTAGIDNEGKKVTQVVDLLSGTTFELGADVLTDSEARDAVYLAIDSIRGGDYGTAAQSLTDLGRSEVNGKEVSFTIDNGQVESFQGKTLDAAEDLLASLFAKGFVSADEFSKTQSEWTYITGQLKAGESIETYGVQHVENTFLVSLTLKEKDGSTRTIQSTFDAVTGDKLFTLDTAYNPKTGEITQTITVEPSLAGGKQLSFTVKGVIGKDGKWLSVELVDIGNSLGELVGDKNKQMIANALQALTKTPVKAGAGKDGIAAGLSVSKIENGIEITDPSGRLRIQIRNDGSVELLTNTKEDGLKFYGASKDNSDEKRFARDANGQGEIYVKKDGVELINATFDQNGLITLRGGPNSLGALSIIKEMLGGQSLKDFMPAFGVEGLVLYSVETNRIVGLAYNGKNNSFLMDGGGLKILDQNGQPITEQYSELSGIKLTLHADTAEEATQIIVGGLLLFENAKTAETNTSESRGFADSAVRDLADALRSAAGGTKADIQEARKLLASGRIYVSLIAVAELKNKGECGQIKGKSTQDLYLSELRNLDLSQLASDPGKLAAIMGWMGAAQVIDAAAAKLEKYSAIRGKEGEEGAKVVGENARFLAAWGVHGEAVTALAGQYWREYAVSAKDGKMLQALATAEYMDAAKVSLDALPSLRVELDKAIKLVEANGNKELLADMKKALSEFDAYVTANQNVLQGILALSWEKDSLNEGQMKALMGFQNVQGTVSAAAAMAGIPQLEAGLADARRGAATGASKVLGEAIAKLDAYVKENKAVLREILGQRWDQAPTNVDRRREALLGFQNVQGIVSAGLALSGLLQLEAGLADARKGNEDAGALRILGEAKSKLSAYISENKALLLEILGQNWTQGLTDAQKGALQGFQSIHGIVSAAITLAALPKTKEEVSSRLGKVNEELNGL
ncbi:MAG: hypothetical protein HY548_07315, partial [Elusimicrobia bacterium]|nr:hypothetical protein [Elusimicrobiota bacterium]